jgi:hypothetical protein
MAFVVKRRAGGKRGESPSDILSRIPQVRRDYLKASHDNSPGPNSPHLISDQGKAAAKEADAQRIAKHYVFAAGLYRAAAMLASSRDDRDRASFYGQKVKEMQKLQGKKGLRPQGKTIRPNSLEDS